MKTIAYISCLGVMATLTVEFGVIGILPQIAEHYKITIDKAGRLLGVYELVAAISGPFMALLLTNMDRKWVIMTCLSVSLLASLLSSLAPAFGWMLAARVFVALTDSVFHAVSLGSVIRNVDEKEDAKMMAIVLSGFSIASITLIPFTAFIGSTLTWQTAFLVKALVSGIVLLLVLIIFPSMPVVAKKIFGSQLKIITRPIFLWTAALCFCMTASAFCLYSYFADYLWEQKQMSAQTISYMLLIFGALGIAGNWLAGKTAGKHLLWTCMATLLSVVVVAIGFQYSGVNMVSNISIIAVWGLLFAFGPLVITTYINRAAPEAMEFGFALTASFIGLGIAVGTSFGGWVIVTKGIHWAPWSGAGFCGAAIITLGIISWLEKKKKVNKPADQAIWV